MPALKNQNHEEFAHAYVALRFNAERAAASLGYPGREGHNILCYQGVAARVRELQRPVLQRWDITADRTMMGLSRVGFADVRRLFDPETGALRPIHELDNDIAGAVKGVKIKEEFETTDSLELDLATGEMVKTRKRIRIVTTEVKMNDRVPALTVLAKHFKLVNDEGDGLNALASALSDRLKAARRQPRAVTVVDSTTPGHVTRPQEIEDARIVETDLRPQPADAELSSSVP